MIPPSSGGATVWGFDVVKDAPSVRENIGVVFQDTTLDYRLSGWENLDLHGRLYGLGGTLRQERIEEVLALVELTDKADSVVKTYSGGMMRRLEIARGLLHRPKVLFLDEPTLGLDPQTRTHIWEYIKTLTAQGITIVLTTHYMEEADHLCGRIAIIDHGEIVALDTPRTLKSNVGGDVIALEVEDATSIAQLRTIFEDNGITNIVSQDDEVSITVNNGEREIPSVLSLASRAGISVSSVSLHKPTLNDVFLYHTGRALRDNSTNGGRTRQRKDAI